MSGAGPVRRTAVEEADQMVADIDAAVAQAIRENPDLCEDEAALEITRGMLTGAGATLRELVAERMGYDLVDVEEYAWERRVIEACERGTTGCSIHHAGDTPCRTWFGQTLQEE